MRDTVPADKGIYVFAPQTDDLFETMLAALHDKGYKIVRIENLTESNQGFCLVYITDELIELFGSADAANEFFSNSGLEFIPVISDEGSRQQKKVLTQYFYTPLEEKSIDRYVRRIDLIISMGSKQLKDWNRIRLSAVNWDSNGRSSRLLLNSEDFSLANDLLRHPIHELLSDSEELVRDIVSATQKQLKKRNKVILAMGFFVGIAFLISGILAVVSKVRSDNAVLQARNQTDSTVADRLSAKAIELMDSDPDLPWLLVDKAISVSETQESMAAAHKISDNLIRHKSYQLPGVGSSIGYLGKNIFVIGYTDGNGITVMDSSSGNIFYSDTAIGDEGACYISVSPQKRYFAANYKSTDDNSEGIKFYRWENNVANWVSTVEIPIESFVWLGDETIIAVVDHKIYGIDIFTGKLENNRSVNLEGLPIAITADENADNLFVVVDQGVTLSIVIYSYLAEKVTGNVPIDGFGQMHYDPVTETLLVDTGVAATLINIAKVKQGKEADVINIQMSFARTLNALTSDQNGSFYFGAKAGTVFIIKPREFKPMNVIYDPSDPEETSGWIYALTADVPQSAVVAHLSDVHDIITVEDGRWATVGKDKMFRIWDSPICGRIKPLLDIAPSSYEARSPGRENALHISLGNVNDSMIATIGTDGFSRVIFDRDTLKIIYDDYGWMYGQAKVAYDTGDIVIVHGLWGNYTFSFVPASSPIDEHKNASEKASIHWLSSLLEISQDGSVIFGVVPEGSERGAYCIERVEGENTVGHFDTTSNMIYLKPIDGSDAMTVNAEGQVFWFSGQHKELFEDSIVLNAVAHISDNRFLSLDMDGNLWLNEDFGDARIIGYFAPSDKGFSIRVSSSGRLAAIIGDYGTKVIDIETGEVKAVLSNLFSQYRESDSVPIHDVLFDKDDKGMVFVYSNGWVSRLDFMKHEEVSAYIHENCPRQFSIDESAIFAIFD